MLQRAARVSKLWCCPTSPASQGSGRTSASGVAVLVACMFFLVGEEQSGKSPGRFCVHILTLSFSLYDLGQCDIFLHL